MPLQPVDFPLLSAEYVNPLASALGGANEALQERYKRQQDALRQAMEQKKFGLEQQNAEAQRAYQNLQGQKLRQDMQFAPKQFDLDRRQKEALIKQAMEQTNYLKTQEQMNQWKMEHPESENKTGMLDYKIFQNQMVDTAKKLPTAKRIIDLAERNKQLYKESPLTGSFGGRLDPKGVASFIVDTQPAQELQSNIETLQTMATQLNNQGRVTNYLHQFTGGTKPTATMGPKAFEHLNDALIAEGNRELLKPAFDTAAYHAGATDAATRQVLWDQFDNDHPPFDIKTKTVNKVGYEKFKDYLTPEAINAARTGQGFGKGSANEQVSSAMKDSQKNNDPLGIR